MFRWRLNWVVASDERHVHRDTRSVARELISEPKVGTPSTVMQVLKQPVAQRLRRKTRRNKDQMDLSAVAPREALRSFWQRRLYDFNVWSAKKRFEKLNYMHGNPVKRGLVAEPGLCG
jgi:REP element-mobilizing transposase RayT